MATKFYNFSGIGKWAKVRKPDPMYNNYSIQVYLDERSKADFEKSGLRLRPKTDEQGTYYTFRRPEEKQFKDDIVTFGPPSVVDKDNEEFTGLIGNGSTVTVKVSVYDTTRYGKGHRLEAVRVDELVEYRPDGTSNPETAAAPVAATASTSKAPATTAPKKKVPF